MSGLWSSLGLGELLTGDLFVTQMGVLGATALLFIGSLVLSLLSFRAASASHKALRGSKELAEEMRHLTAQVEFSSRPPSTAHGDHDDHDYGPEDRSIDLTEHDRAETRSHSHLEAATRAATEPSALLRGRLRRR